MIITTNDYHWLSPKDWKAWTKGRQRLITACGLHKCGGCVPSRVNCENCKKTKAYKKAAIDFELKYENNVCLWEDEMYP